MRPTEAGRLATAVLEGSAAALGEAPVEAPGAEAEAPQEVKAAAFCRGAGRPAGRSQRQRGHQLSRPGDERDSPAAGCGWQRPVEVHGRRPQRPKISKELLDICVAHSEIQFPTRLHAGTTPKATVEKVTLPLVRKLFWPAVGCRPAPAA